VYQLPTSKIFCPFLIGLIVVVLFSSNLRANSDNGINSGIKLSVKALEPLTNRDEPIKLEMSFESSKENYRIYRHPTFGIAAAIGPNDWVSFEIISPGGAILKEYGSHLPNPKRPHKGDHVDVFPGNSYKEIVNVYPSIYQKGAFWPRTGDYRIRATYSYKHRNEWKYGRDLWQGKLESNWLTIKVR
jgi:hypothetical protein